MAKKGSIPASTKKKIAERTQNYPKSIAAHRLPSSLGGGFSVEGASVGHDYDSLRLPPEIKDPRFQQDNYYIPQTDAFTGEPNIVLNYWLDYYYRFHPLVGSLIDLHSLLPLSRFGLTGIGDSAILRDYEEMVEDCQMFERMVDTLRLYFLRGEAQPFLWWNDDLGRFTDITMLDTTHIFALGHYLLYSPDGDVTRSYQLRPDDYIRSLANSSNPTDQALVRDFLDEKILMAIQQNMNVELDPFATEMIIRAANPWHLRGSSICEGILKDLIYEDTLRKAQNSIAQAHITPIKMWKIGDKDNPALPEDLTAFREVLFEANNDPQVNLVTHHAVNLTIDGASGRILPLGPEFEHVENRILTRLFASKALTTGEGVQYANASVALRVLMSRYIPIRVMLENFFYRKCFLPVAITKGYYKITTAQLSHRVRASEKDREPLYPIFDWRHKQSLIDDSNIKSLLIQLQQRTLMPMKVVCDSLDLDYDYVKEYLKKEQGSVFDESLLQARKTEITSIGQDGKPTRFQVWFKSIFNWQRMLGGTAKEREELLKEKQPIESEQPDMPSGPDGADAITPDNLDDFSEDMGDFDEVESPDSGGEGEGEGSKKKKPNLTMNPSLSASRKRTDIINKTWTPTIEKYLQGKKHIEKEGKTTYKIRDGLFKAAEKSPDSEWLNQLSQSPHLDAATKKGIRNLDISLKGIFQSTKFASKVEEHYAKFHRVEGETFNKIGSEALISCTNTIQGEVTREFTRLSKKLVSHFYDMNAVAIGNLTSTQKVALKKSVDRQLSDCLEMWGTYTNKPCEASLQYLKKFASKNDVCADLADTPEVSASSIADGSGKVWRTLEATVLEDVRDGMYQALTTLKVGLDSSLKRFYNRKQKPTQHE